MGWVKIITGSSNKNFDCYPNLLSCSERPEMVMLIERVNLCCSWIRQKQMMGQVAVEPLCRSGCACPPPSPIIASLPQLAFVGPGRGRNAAEVDPEWADSQRPSADHTIDPEQGSKSLKKKDLSDMSACLSQCVTFNIKAVISTVSIISGKVIIIVVVCALLTFKMYETFKRI